MDKHRLAHKNLVSCGKAEYTPVAVFLIFVLQQYKSTILPKNSTDLWNTSHDL